MFRNFQTKQSLFELIVLFNYGKYLLFFEQMKIQQIRKLLKHY